MRDPKLLLVGHYSAFDDDTNEVKIYGGGMDCSIFGTHFNPLISKLVPETVTHEKIKINSLTKCTNYIFREAEASDKDQGRRLNLFL